MTIDVGTLFAPNVRLFVRLIPSPPAAVVGTVMTTGDQPAAVGFNLAQVASEPPVTAAPQL
jgi:hypothetical protein